MILSIIANIGLISFIAGHLVKKRIRRKHGDDIVARECDPMRNQFDNESSDVGNTDGVDEIKKVPIDYPVQFVDNPSPEMFDVVDTWLNSVHKYHVKHGIGCDGCWMEDLCTNIVEDFCAVADIGEDSS